MSILFRLRDTNVE